MNTIGVVALAFIGGIFLIVVCLALAASLWISWFVYKQVKALRVALEAYDALQVQHLEAQSKAMESGKGVFQGIRADMKSILDAQSSEMRQTFKMFEDAFRGALRNLNGKAMMEASKQNVSAVKRLEFVAQSLGELISSAGAADGTPSEWSESARATESASPEQSRVGRSVYDRDAVDETETGEAFDRMVGGELFTQ